MDKIESRHLKKIEKYLDDLVKSKPKQSKELELNEIAKLMKKIGFSDPINKRGVARAFSHELLTDPMLVDGSFTIHIIHGRNRELFRYQDFYQFVLPNIKKVIEIIKAKGLIIAEEGSDAQF